MAKYVIFLGLRLLVTNECIEIFATVEFKMNFKIKREALCNFHQQYINK